MIALIRSTASAVGTPGKGVRKHAMEHYLDLVQAGRVDLSAMLTHVFSLDEWRDAFTAIADQENSGAIKVAIKP